LCIIIIGESVIFNSTVIGGSVTRGTAVIVSHYYGDHCTAFQTAAVSKGGLYNVIRDELGYILYKKPEICTVYLNIIHIRSNAISEITIGFC